MCLVCRSLAQFIGLLAAVVPLVVAIRSFDSTPLSTALFPYVIHFLLVFSPLTRILDLHEARGQLRLDLLHVLDAELTPYLVELLIYSLELVVLGLQLLLLLDVFLEHLLVEFLMFLFRHFKLVGAANFAFRGTVRPVQGIFLKL